MAFWLGLPEGLTNLELWSCLHDGELCACVSDTRAQTLVLRFRVRHLLGEVDVLFTLRGVRRAIATKHPVPYDFEEPEGVSSEEHTALVNAYQATWRTESMEWASLEAALSTDPLQIADADVFFNEEHIAIEVGGFLDGEVYDDLYCSILVQGASL